VTSSRELSRSVIVILLSASAFLLAVYLIYRLAGIIEWILVAAFLAVALNPAVKGLHRRGLPRRWAILIVLLVLFGAIVAIATLALPSLVGQVRGIANVLRQPGGFSSEVMRVAAPLGLGGLVQTLRSQLDALPGQVASAVGSFTSITASAINLGTAVVTVFVLMIFFLDGGARIVDGTVDLFPEAYRPRLHRLLEASANAVSGYVSGNLAISFIAGAGVTIGLTLLGVPYALALGLLLAVFDLIPMVGATLGAIPPILAAFAVSPVKALILLVYIIIYQQIESQVLNPLVYGRSVHLPGLVVFLAVLIGGSLMGILGALIAIPAAEILRLVLQEVVGGRAQRSAVSPAAVPQAEIAKR
jgi:predicted PurR-regulated permease PerM